MKTTPERDAVLEKVDFATILPCPACNQPIVYPDEIWFRGPGPPPSDAVECGSCGARGPFSHGGHRGDYAGSLRDAIKLWNEMPRA